MESANVPQHGGVAKISEYHLPTHLTPIRLPKIRFSHRVMAAMVPVRRADVAMQRIPACIVAQRLSIPRLAGLKRFMVEIRRRPLPRYGTDHDSKPLPSFPRFCIPARPLQCRQEEYRSGRATAQWFGRSLLALPFAGGRLRPTRRTAL